MSLFFIIGANVGYANPQTTGVTSYQIIINGTPYIGSLNSIQLNVGDQFQIIATPVDPTQAQYIQFTTIPQNLFDVYKQI